MKKRIISLLLAVVMIVGIVPLEMFAASAEDYHITDSTGWSAFAAQVKGGETFQDQTVVLDGNISVTESVGEWSTYPFSGTFEGNGNTVTFTNTDDTSNKGVFGYTLGASIRNLKVDGEIGGAWSLGGVVGCAKDTEITNCQNRASVTSNGTDDVAYAGGIVGVSEGGNTISGCTNFGTVAGNKAVGGIIGEARVDDEIRNCINRGAVSGNQYLGGILGNTPDTYNSITVANCINYGNIDVRTGGENAGGIAGHMAYGGAVKNCFTSGVISGGEKNGVAVGWVNRKFTCENLYYEALSGNSGLPAFSVGGEIEVTPAAAPVESKKDAGMLAAMNEKADQHPDWYSWIFADNAATLTEYYTVTFAHNGAYAPVPAAQYVKNGDKATKPTEPVKYGFGFDGWYADENLTVPFDFNTPITRPTTLYAKWKKKYTVEFDINGGDGSYYIPLTQYIKEGDRATRPEKAPAKVGYTFSAWYDSKKSGAPYDFDTPITQNMTLYAHYDEDQHHLTYSDIYGTGLPQDQTMCFTEAAYISDVVPTWQGHIFKGWATHKEASTAEYLPGDLFMGKGVVKKSITLYAVWEEAELRYVIRRWNNDSKTVESREIVFPKGVIALKDSENDVTLDAGAWYYVTGEVAVPKIEVNGTENNPTTLILTDGCTLTATKGVHLPGGHALHIYGQEKDSGKLIATGGSWCAGIGGSGDEDGGALTVYGGTVDATGGNKGAGIGGGNCGDGGTVTVYGGTVTATNLDGSAAGIGAGADGNNHGNLSIPSKNALIKAGDDASSSVDSTVGQYVENRNRYVQILCIVNGEGYGESTETTAGGAEGSALSDGNIWIIIAIAVAALVGIAALAAVKKKKKPALASGENKDEE